MKTGFIEAPRSTVQLMYLRNWQICVYLNKKDTIRKWMEYCQREAEIEPKTMADGLQSISQLELLTYLI